MSCQHVSLIIRPCSRPCRWYPTSGKPSTPPPTYTPSLSSSIKHSSGAGCSGTGESDFYETLAKRLFGFSIEINFELQTNLNCSWIMRCSFHVLFVKYLLSESLIFVRAMHSALRLIKKNPIFLKGLDCRRVY